LLCGLPFLGHGAEHRRHGFAVIVSIAFWEKLLALHPIVHHEV
jgi:hypothetical protein